VICRGLTEWTGTNQGVVDQSSVSDGIGGVVFGVDSNGLVGPVNVRDKYVHGINNAVHAAPANFTAGTGSGSVPSSTGGVKRRYQVHLATGLFNQEKLVCC
jgi:hypothetical protein